MFHLSGICALSYLLALQCLRPGWHFSPLHGFADEVLVSAQEESSEYETDSEDETNARQLLKPVFVRKSEREVSSAMHMTRLRTMAAVNRLPICLV